MKYQGVMWLSGLRGPVSFALAHGAPNERGIILTSTLMIIFLTTFIIGGVTLPICSWLDLAVGPKRFNRRATWFHKIDGRFLRPIFGVPRRLGWKQNFPSSGNVMMEHTIWEISSCRMHGVCQGLHLPTVPPQ